MKDYETQYKCAAGAGDGEDALRVEGRVMGPRPQWPGVTGDIKAHTVVQSLQEDATL